MNDETIFHSPSFVYTKSTAVVTTYAIIAYVIGVYFRSGPGISSKLPSIPLQHSIFVTLTVNPPLLHYVSFNFLRDDGKSAIIVTYATITNINSLYYLIVVMFFDRGL